ncbi:DUF4190 domain-containing protein [Actinoplanes sp. NPDC049265]|uniref:DUF4190 domain-containing protein n=1 Tax=Actinoplanes sp. NPDC049265 TaxID=3363902 RepID=UPI003718B301
MTYPPSPPPGPGGPVPSPEPIQPYQPPQNYVPDNPYAPAPYQQQPPPYTQPQVHDYGYGSPYSQGYGSTLKPPAEGLAIASLVISCIAVPGALCGSGFGGLIGVVGAVLGHVAQRRIRRNGTSGSGMALAGIIVGWVATMIAMVVLAVIVFAIASSPDSASPFDY